MNFSSAWVKNSFPIFKNFDIAYLDNAASTQKPYQVLNAVKEYNETTHANIHRGSYKLSLNATRMYDRSREKVKTFLNASKNQEIIFTKGTTEGINLLANSLGMSFLAQGDEIVISKAEHHSNILPWQQIAKIKNCSLKYLDIDQYGRIRRDSIEQTITEKTKIVSVSSISNALGTVQPIKTIIDVARRVGAYIILDVAQEVPHEKINMESIGADFIIFSGHKMYAPTGIGVLCGSKQLLNEMTPYQSGGDMIEFVGELESTYAPVPMKFEAGTPNIEGAIGVGAAIDFIQSIGLEDIKKKEKELTIYAYNKLKDLEYVTIYGDKKSDNFSPVISFNINGVHSHDTASILDSENVAIRSGHHCAQILMKTLNLSSTCRVSLSFYNSFEDIDRLINALEQAKKVMKI